MEVRHVLALQLEKWPFYWLETGTHFVKHDARQLIIKIIFSSAHASAFVSVTI